jgi:hypothetical protein
MFFRVITRKLLLGVIKGATLLKMSLGHILYPQINAPQVVQYLLAHRHKELAALWKLFVIFKSCYPQSNFSERVAVLLTAKKKIAWGLLLTIETFSRGWSPL